MSHLDKVAIQGIRSFDSEQKQMVKFFPLTIILGPNGAGKTSIIEALKYVTTGETPPNSSKGKTFVLDPELAKAATVRAQVQLSFVDVHQQRCVITRSVELKTTKSRGKPGLTFKSLNQVIKKGDNAVDQRCADINSEMLELLGVSKAVLTNVIFCHQEESNWPLSEGKALKEKFDDIFGSMGYVKALEKIKKSRKSELNNTKLLEKDVDKAKFIKDQCDDKKNKLMKLQVQLDSLKTYYADSDTKLNVYKEELAQVVSTEERVLTLCERINRIKGTVNEKQKTLDKLKASIKTPFQGSEDELKSEIDNFEVNTRSLREKCNSLKTADSELTNTYKALMESQQILNRELTKLQVSEENHKKVLKERNQLVSKLTNETNVLIDLNILDKINSNQILDSFDIQIVFNCLKEKLFELNKELTECVTSEANKSQDLRQKLNEVQSTKSKFEHEVKLWANQQDVKMKALKDLKTKLMASSGSEEKYEELNKKIKDLTDEIEKMEGLNVDKRKRELEDKEKDKKELREQIVSIENKLQDMQQQNEERIRSETFTKDKKEKERRFKQIQDIHNDVLRTLNASDGQFQASLDAHIRALNSKIETKTNDLQKREMELKTEETKVEMNSESVRKMKRELKDLELKLKKFCKLEDYENILSLLNREIKDLRFLYSEKSNYEPFLKAQLESIHDQNCCPVCERDVNTEWNSKKGHKLSKRTLIQKIEKLLNQTPDEIKDLEKKIKEKEQQLHDMNGLMSVVESIRSLSQKLPNLEKEIASNVEKNTQQKTDIQREKIHINKQKTELNAMRDIMSDATESDQIWSDIQDLTKKIERIDFVYDSQGESVDDLAEELKIKRAKYEEIEAKISSIQTVIQTYTENYNQRRTLLQNYEREKLEIEKSEHQMTNNKKRLEELEAEIKDFDDKITDSQMKAIDMEPKIDEIRSQLKDLENEFKDCERRLRNEIQIITDKKKDLERLNKDIEEYAIDDKSVEIERLNKQLEESQNELSIVETQKQTISSDLNRVTEELSGLDMKKRELTDSLRVFEIEAEMVIAKSELKTEEDKIGFSNIHELKLKKKELEKTVKETEAVRNKSEARQGPIIEAITGLERDLKSEPFKSADSTYKQWLIDHAISEIAGDDLNKYYKALDFAVSDFHRKKIEEINKLIKGFWRQAYRGLDIDHIKIVSNEIERSANDKRSTFDYKVVMVRGGTEMDMRGRCSAGQKVLASLIIRLALAEIFCSNCSVLALDEPTTNLDKHNIESFANAVTEIVKYRKKWKDSNFQLIIITHDEEFLKCLDSETGHHYYRVKKDRNGFSKIWQHSTDDNLQNSDNE